MMCASVTIRLRGLMYGKLTNQSVTSVSGTFVTLDSGLNTEIAHAHGTRNQAIMAAYATGDYSYQQLAEFFRLHFTTVGKIVRAGRGEQQTKRQ